MGAPVGHRTKRFPLPGTNRHIFREVQVPPDLELQVQARSKEPRTVVPLGTHQDPLTKRCVPAPKQLPRRAYPPMPKVRPTVRTSKQGQVPSR